MLWFTTLLKNLCATCLSIYIRNMDILLKLLPTGQRYRSQTSGKSNSNPFKRVGNA